MRTIRTLTRAEVETLVGWAASEGWNPGLADSPAFHAADPEGFLGAFVEGEFVAGISAVAYDETFGFIGLYICHPAHRGQGHGKAVWDAGMARLGNRTIGLDGVPAQQGNYRSMGFEPAYDTIRMTGRPRHLGADAASVGSVGQIAPIDSAIFPAVRTAFLAEWIKPPRRVLMLDGGYGAVRQCVTDHKIGPLFAPDPDTALRLLGALTTETVSIDVPVAQLAFLKALADAGFTESFSTTRMYRGPTLGPAPAQVFGITSLELG
jgi:hypothetical protein